MSAAAATPEAAPPPPPVVPPADAYPVAPVPAGPVVDVPAPPVMPVVKDISLFSLEEGSINPLAARCNIVLALLAYICYEKPATGHHDITGDISQALSRVMRELARAGGYDLITQKSAHYCLCVAADTVLAKHGLSNPDKNAGGFLKQHYGVSFNDGCIYPMGLRLLQQPQQYREVLELIYLCLNLGFDQFSDQRDSRFAVKRQDLLDKIRRTFMDDWRDGDDLEALAMREVVSKPYRVKVNLPVWPIYVLTPLVLAGVYWLFNRDLNERLVAVLELLKRI